MSRTVRDSRLETRAARDRLKPRSAPYWRSLAPGLHLGYRRRRKGAVGSWLARVYQPDGAGEGSPYRVTSLGLADDFEDAAMNYSEAMKRAHDAASRPVDRLNVTVADAVADYVRYLKLERKTGAEVESAMKFHVLPKFGNRRVSDLTTRELKHWRDELAEGRAMIRTRAGATRRLKPPAETEDRKRARKATTNRIVTMFKAALNIAFRDGLVSSDLAWRRVTPFKNTDAARQGHLSIAEAQRLINAADEASGFRDLVRAALLTGCRYGELCRLRVFDFADGKLAIRGSKTGSRHVTLTDEGVDFFIRLCAGRPRDEIMLVRGDGKGWLRAQQARPMQDACEGAKISPAIGIHQLRHTWASLAVMAGMPLMVVARNLGHRDTRMVERFYGHLTNNFVDEMIRAHAPKFGIERDNVTVLHG
jgi:integrase